MFKKIVITWIVLLIILSKCIAQEEQGRVLQILSIAKEINATDVQIAEAIANGDTPKEFVTKTLDKLRLIAPEKASPGSPVQIQVEGLPEKAAELWRRFPVYSSDVWLELFDRAGNPINIFWSSDQGPRTFELIVAENGPEIPTINIATHKLEYGSEPIPGPQPPLPSPTLQHVVSPLADYAKRIEAQDLYNLTEFYMDFANIIKRDTSIIKNTLVFRNTYSNAGQLMFQQTGMQGKYAGLSELVDNIISDQLGLDIVPLDREKTASVLSAIAWAFHKGGTQ